MLGNREAQLDTAHRATRDALDHADRVMAALDATLADAASSEPALADEAKALLAGELALVDEEIAIARAQCDYCERASRAHQKEMVEYMDAADAYRTMGARVHRAMALADALEAAYDRVHILEATRSELSGSLDSDR